MQAETKVKVEEINAPSGEPIIAIRISGDITSASKPAVLGAYQGLPKDLAKLVVLDFSKTDYLNSSGIAIVITLLMEAHAAGQTVKCFGLSKHFEKVFAMVGLAKYTTLHVDEAAAAAAFA